VLSHAAEVLFAATLARVNFQSRLEPRTYPQRRAATRTTARRFHMLGSAWLGIFCSNSS